VQQEGVVSISSINGSAFSE